MVNNEDAFQISQNQIEEVVALAKEHGLEIIGLHWLLAFTQGLNLTSPEEATRIRTADYLIQLAQICRQLGGHVMVLGSPQQRQMASAILPLSSEGIGLRLSFCGFHLTIIS